MKELSQSIVPKPSFSRCAFLLAFLAGLSVVLLVPSEPGPPESSVRVIVPRLPKKRPAGESFLWPNYCGGLFIKVDETQQVRLNNEDMGNVSDLSNLKSRIKQIIEERTRQGVRIKMRPEYAVFAGYEFIGADVFVMVPRSMKYGDAMNVIDAAAAAGPVLLVLDVAPAYEARSFEYEPGWMQYLE